jgi:hypothetical protein
MRILATVEIWRPSSFPCTGDRLTSLWVPRLPISGGERIRCEPMSSTRANLLGERVGPYLRCSMKHRDVTFMSFTCCNPCCVKVACPGSLRAHMTHFLCSRHIVRAGAMLPHTHTQTQCGCLLSQQPFPPAFRLLFSMWANVNTVNTALANNTQTSGASWHRCDASKCCTGGSRGADYEQFYFLRCDTV